MEPPDAELPDGLELARTTDEFTETTLPAGLLRTHRVAPNTWGRLVVRAGAIEFAFEDGRPRTVGGGETQVIPPQVPHQVRVIGPVRLVIEFHRPAPAG